MHHERIQTFAYIVFLLQSPAVFAETLSKKSAEKLSENLTDKSGIHSSGKILVMGDSLSFGLGSSNRTDMGTFFSSESAD